MVGISTRKRAQSKRKSEFNGIFFIGESDNFYLARNGNKAYYSIFRCRCGNIFEALYSAISNQYILGCPDCVRLGKAGIEFRTPENTYRAYSKSPAAKKYGFDKTDEFKSYFISLIGIECIHCGEIGYGIDRIDSSKGYVFDNVQPCCSECNYLKTNLSDDKFYERICKIYQHQERKFY